LPATERSERLQQLTLALGDALTEAAVAQVVLKHAVPALGADAGSIARLSPAGSMLELIGWIGYPDEVGLVRRFSVEEKVPHALAVKRAQPVFAETYAESQKLLSRLPERWSGPGIYALAALPLMAGGRMMGSLGVSFNQERIFTEEDRSLALIVSRLCAQALQRAQAFEREQRTRREAEEGRAHLELLANASHQLFGSLDPVQICQALVELAIEANLSEFASVNLVMRDSGGTIQRIAMHARDPIWLELDKRRLELPRHALESNAIIRAIQTRSPQLTTASELPEAPPQRAGWKVIARRFHLRSRLVVPLLAGAEALGALTLVTSALTGSELGQRDLVLATELGSRAAAALQNSRLYVQSREAIAVRDDFLSIAGHELRTPLTALKLQLQSSLRLMTDGAGKAQLEVVADRTERAVHQVQRLQALVERLLDVSRITAGRFAVEPESLSLDQLARECVARFAEEAESAGCKLTLRERVGKRELRGRWDRMRLEQLFANLLANAAKFGRGQPIEVEVGESADPHGRLGFVVVRDHGIGIAYADQARIFQRFERAATAKRIGGLGLGLWISRQIVLAHQGTLTLESAPGEGAEFVVSLPLIDELAPA
jgi:signal transduction histidine kinase